MKHTILSQVREVVDGFRRPHMNWCRIGKPETNPASSFHIARCSCGADTYNFALDNILGKRDACDPYHGFEAGTVYEWKPKTLADIETEYTNEIKND